MTPEEQTVQTITDCRDKLAAGCAPEWHMAIATLLEVEAAKIREHSKAAFFAANPTAANPPSLRMMA
jgi:hypothetical protein